MDVESGQFYIEVDGTNDNSNEQAKKNTQNGMHDFFGGLFPDIVIFAGAFVVLVKVK